MIVKEQCEELFSVMEVEGKRLCAPFAFKEGRFGIGGVVAVSKAESLEVCVIFEIVRFHDGAQRTLFYTDQALCAKGGDELLERAAELVYRIFEEVTKYKSEELKEKLKKEFLSLLGTSS
ncbi:MAG: hypothetical protein GXO07_01570 [Crenarchaeota archaeon]|nr:hypothetical protein [Thermoproteota archaeon]